MIVLIAIQAFILTQLGLALGGQLNRRVHEVAERLAGVALEALALALLAEQLLR